MPSSILGNSIPETHYWLNLLNTGNAGFSIDLFTKEIEIHFTIVDQLGRKVKSFDAETKVGWNKLSWNIDDLASGMYFLHRSDASVNKTLPFIVSKNF